MARRKFCQVLIAAAVSTALFVSIPATADETFSKSIAAVSGKPARLSAFWKFGENCEPLTLGVNTHTKPSNGTVQAKVVTRKIVPTAETDFSGQCAGKSTKAIELYYRSKSGFKGKDRTVVTVVDAGKRYRYVFNLNVR